MANVYSPSRYIGSGAATGVKWHYTTSSSFRKILVEGTIKPATAYIEKHERAIVWFSVNPIWEPTACHGIPHSGYPGNIKEVNYGDA